MPDRVLLVEAELDLATAILGLPATPRFAETRKRPLAFLTQAREDLRGCVSVPPKAPPAPRRLSGPSAAPVLTHYPCRCPRRLLRITPPGN